jgi:hypothetical protein
LTIDIAWSYLLFLRFLINNTATTAITKATTIPVGRIMSYALGWVGSAEAEAEGCCVGSEDTVGVAVSAGVEVVPLNA